MNPFKRIRQTLYKIHPLPYRIKPITPNEAHMDRKLFLETLDTLKLIEDRRDFLQDEIGMDVTVYEDKFFIVIENLLKLHFNKSQLAIIKLFLYELQPEEDWDGTITIQQDSSEKSVKFKTSADVWNIIKDLKK